MSREAHVRFCEGVGVKLPRATRLNIYVRSEAAVADLAKDYQAFLAAA